MLEVIDSCSSYLPVDMFKTQPNISHYTPCAVLQSCRAHQGMAYLPGFTSMVLPGATSATAAAMLWYCWPGPTYTTCGRCTQVTSSTNTVPGRSDTQHVAAARLWP